MKIALSFIVASLLLGFAHAGEPGAARQFMCCDYNGNQVCIVGKDGAIEWRIEAKHPQDCWKLANGNILFCHMDGAKIVDKDKTVVWEYKAPAGVECHGCQPLSDGRVMVVECGTSRIVEVDEKGQIAKEIKLKTATTAMHEQFRGTRKTSDGHYLICFKGEKKIVEIDGEGKVLREVPVAGDPHEVVKLADGNLLITCGDGHKVVEVDPAGKTVWELGENDVPGNPLRLMAGCQRLPNGNTIFCVYLGHGFLGKQPHFFEITRDKKLVWEFADHVHFKTINQIFALDIPGDPSKGEIFR